MNVALRVPMTLEQFLDWEERQEERYEFDGSQPVARAGGTASHAFIQSNLILAVGSRLRGTACRVVGSELKIAVAGSIRYPDAFIICTPVQPGAMVVTEPVVVFGILSGSTMNDDLIIKNAEYRETPSIRRYVVLQQASASAMVFTHRGGEWAIDLVAGLAATLHIAEVGIDIPLSEIYADVVLAGEVREEGLGSPA